MNSKLHRFISILILLLLMAAPQMAPAQDILVSSVDPASAIQGTIDLEVAIGGQGFDKTVHEVIFLLPCAVEPCTDTGGITVKKFKVRGKNKIIANIDISGEATVADFDIRISLSRGRGGKGTTLFKVNQAGGGSGGSVDPTFEVMIGGDLLGEGDPWLRPSSGSSSIRYFAWEDPTKKYFINLNYFRVTFNERGPSPDEGEKCFGPIGPIDSADSWTEIKVGAINRSKSGAAVASFLFTGTTTDTTRELIDYALELFGTFDDPEANWPPREGEVNSVKLTDWMLRLAPKRIRKKFSDISCVGEISDQEDFLTIMEVVRDP